MLQQLFDHYIYYYKLSIGFSLLFFWLILSYIDRVHFRERIRRIGIYFSYFITTILPSRYLFTQLRLFILRPVCVCLEGLTGLFEGMENTEAIVKISSNKKDLFSCPNTVSSIPTIDMDIPKTLPTVKSSSKSNSLNPISSIRPTNHETNSANITLDCRKNSNIIQTPISTKTTKTDINIKHDSLLQQNEQKVFDKLSTLINQDNHDNNDNHKISSESDSSSSSDSDNTSSDNSFPFTTSSKVTVTNKQKKTVPIKLARRKCNFGK